MPKVYIIQQSNRIIRDPASGEVLSVDSKFDYTPAAKYGDLEYLLPSGDVALSPQPMVNTLRNKLKDFSDEDFLLPTGDPVCIMAAAVLASNFNNGKAKVLKWNKRSNEYFVVNIDFTGAR
jgi:hypothetical protein